MDRNPTDFLDKARWLCARRETSKKELVQKLRKKGCPRGRAQEIIDHLEAEGALNETRFAEAFVRDKMERQKWGRYRIREGLKEKGLEEGVIEDAIDGIDEGTEEKTLRKVLMEKWKEGLRKGKEDAREKAIAAAERKGHPLSKILERMEGASSPDSLDRIEPGSHHGG